ncbi:MAG: DUF6364 family protein [Thermodesulfobacteriota bacterium]
MPTKLTLRLDEELIRRAKSFAKKRGKSVSQIVANYFASLDKKPQEPSTDLTPIVRSLKGTLRGMDAEVKDYRKHLEERYL